jgi:KDO2-lipid IV(A) lauroyltransferase
MKQAPVQHAVEYALFLPFAAILRALPHGASRRLGAALGALAHLVDRRRRRIALDNLRRAFPDRDAAELERWVGDCFRHFGAAFADALSALRFDRIELCRRVTVVGLEHLIAAEAAGRGVILLSAHFGNWEIAPPFIALARGPMATVGRAVDNPHFEPLLTALRTRFGNRMLDKRGSVRDMFRVLREGGRLGLLIDQRVRAAEGIDVPFFGRPALTSPIVARLAQKTGAAVVTVFGQHLPRGRYRVEFAPPLTADAGDDEAATFAFTRRCLELCETVIRRDPPQWLWLHDRWKH